MYSHTWKGGLSLRNWQVDTVHWNALALHFFPIHARTFSTPFFFYPDPILRSLLFWDSRSLILRPEDILRPDRIYYTCEILCLYYSRRGNGKTAQRDDKLRTYARFRSDKFDTAYGFFGFRVPWFTGPTRCNDYAGKIHNSVLQENSINYLYRFELIFWRNCFKSDNPRHLQLQRTPFTYRSTHL